MEPSIRLVRMRSIHVLCEVVEDAVFLDSELHHVVPLSVGAGGELKSTGDGILDLHATHLQRNRNARRGKGGRWRDLGKTKGGLGVEWSKDDGRQETVREGESHAGA
jgi:hypothetical protein